MQLSINAQEITVKWAENLSVQALADYVQDQNLELVLEDYAFMEKVGELPITLPSNNEDIRTEAGDIILYQGRKLVIYYDRNHYSLTPIGKIQGMSKIDIQELLGWPKTVRIRLTN